MWFHFINYKLRKLTLHLTIGIFSPYKPTCELKICKRSRKRNSLVKEDHFCSEWLWLVSLWYEIKIIIILKMLTIWKNIITGEFDTPVFPSWIYTERRWQMCAVKLWHHKVKICTNFQNAKLQLYATSITCCLMFNVHFLAIVETPKCYSVRRGTHHHQYK